MIRLEDVEVRAGSFTLHVDDLALGDGEVLVILGPTGSGKTVLLETVAGLRAQHSGHIWFGDREVTREAPERRRVGIVYQDYALFPHLTVAGNIGFGLRARRSDGRREADQGGSRASATSRAASRVSELAALVGITPLLERYPDGLSGGEKQRVALARALAIHPEVLLLDEPLSALDRQTRESLRSLLKGLQRDIGATVMHVTHDLDEALAVADRLAVLIDGRVRQIGLSDEVLHRPADAEVAGLLGTRNVFAAHLAGGAENGLRFAIANGGPELVAPATSFHPVGSAAGGLCVVIRPEEIEILPDGTASSGLRESVGEAGPNILNGAVREIHFHSSHAVVEIDVPPVLSVHVLRPKLRKLGLERGMRARLYVPPAAIHICARSG